MVLYIYNNKIEKSRWCITTSSAYRFVFYIARRICFLYCKEDLHILG